MELVRCISIRKSIPDQIVVGRIYWIDGSSRFTDSNGCEYADVYADEEKFQLIGRLKTHHFKTVYRYLLYGGSLSSYVNSHEAFLLKDIITWCCNYPCDVLANNILEYISDHKLNEKENMEKEFVINSIPFNEFAKRNMASEYERYCGYSLYQVN